MNEGIAYALFECESKPEEVKGEIASIRDIVGTSEKVKSEIGEVAREKGAQNQPRLYAIEVRIPGGKNREAADELANILNQAYQSPLWKK